jgi:hypothetical protein
MAVVKVHTTKNYSNQPFFQKMDIAWGFARKWSIRPVEDNLFVLQVPCWRDPRYSDNWLFCWSRMMELLIQRQ